MKLTPIEWCDSTVNPTDFMCDGCELWQPRKGVRFCYAGRFAERRAGVGAFDKPIAMKPGRTLEAARWPDLRGVKRPEKPWIPAAYPRLIFVGDMADTLSAGVTFEYLHQEIVKVALSAAGRRHIWMWLTKRPKRLEQFSEWLAKQGVAWPSNLWPGTSITGPGTLSRARSLCEVGDDGTVRFLSCEPLWESLEPDEGPHAMLLWDILESQKISLVISGGQSGPGAKPCQVEWLSEIVDMCEFFGVQSFVKQLGSNVRTHNANTMNWPDTVNFAAESPATGFASGRALLKDKKGGNWDEWPDELKVREFPKL